MVSIIIVSIIIISVMIIMIIIIMSIIIIIISSSSSVSSVSIVIRSAGKILRIYISTLRYMLNTTEQRKESSLQNIADSIYNVYTILQTIERDKHNKLYVTYTQTILQTKFDVYIHMYIYIYREREREKDR